MLKNSLKLLYQILPNIIQKQLMKVWKQLFNFKILAQSYGQFRTITKWSCIDACNNPVPWYTYPAIEYLSHLNLYRRKVFEFGSGHSSLWWLNKSESVTAVEDNEQWYNKISEKANRKATATAFKYIFAQEESRYINSFDSTHADIVIIDGKHRQKCSDHVLALYKNNKWSGEILIFDNSDWYPDTILKIRNTLGWVQADFHGFGPINNYTWTTTIFLNPEKHKTLNYIKPLSPIAGINNNAESENIIINSK